MTPALFFLYILGTAAAIPTNARFLSGHLNPTTAALVTPDDAIAPSAGVEAAADIENYANDKAEQPSALKSEEENHEQSTEQDKAYSQEEDLKDMEDGGGDLSVNLDYSPTEGAIHAQDSTSEPPRQEKLPESTDFPVVASTSSVDSKLQANVTKGEGSPEQSEGDVNQQLNKNNQNNQDLMDEESPEEDPGAPDEEEEEEEEEPEDVGAPSDNQEREKEPPEEQPISKQEGDSDQSDDPLEESSQPTQLSKTENRFEQGNQGQEGNSNAEGEDKTASSMKHIQHTEWQGQEGKTVLEATGSQKDVDEKTVSVEPTDSVAILAWSHGASYDGSKDDSKHGTSDDYFIPSQELLEAGKTDPLSYYLKRAEQATDENEKVGKSDAGDNQRAKKAESSPNVEPSDEGNSRGHSADSCRNFQCKRGHTCEADQQGKPHCVCQDPETCPPSKLLDQVCGTDNQTYASSCHLFATKCQLEGTKKGHQLQLDYFGACKSIPACTDFEVAQFPLRMRDWLKNILMQLYEPNPKHEGYLNEKQRSKVKKIYLDEKRLLAGDHPIELLLRDFKKNYHMYVYPVHWQFNELDQHPADRILTHSELAPLRASLVPMEHCITRFFEECDPNKDKHITLKEWGHCFGIKEEDIDENLLF
ncbi:SPARC-like protein 1 isoform X1 [Arvicola amphibius]|uniref:SPARC-like protein 1 isoform X1 n=1 Tax=Arvicola amphibius TaxID=1047088 RepID=UPI0018E39CC3|nr:SPARC-like protein 1 isoform X1 [Arvicola amphibius]